MKRAATILKLKVGDTVKDYRGVFGTVRDFSRNGVSIRWGEDDLRWYNDDDLDAAGIVRVSPLDKDTEPTPKVEP